MFDIRSLTLLPHARIVQPRKELLRFVVTPITNRTLTISEAHTYITPTAPNMAKIERNLTRNNGNGNGKSNGNISQWDSVTIVTIIH